jgi:phosphohistidine phosphatase
VEAGNDVAGRAAADGYDVNLRPREVILVRHAHADWPNYNGRDFDRPLTPRGVADARSSAAAIHAASLQPQLLIASPAKRTTQTAQIIAAALALPAPAITYVAALYNATAAVLDVEMRRAFGSNPRIILVAHNPGISDLARALTGDATMAAFSPGQWLHCPVQPG